MMRGRNWHTRQGMVLAEAGIIYSVTLFLLLGAILAGFESFRYHQIVWLAREGARWAAVNGPTYQSEQSKAAPTAQAVLASALGSRKMAGLNTSKLTATLTWNTSATPPTVTFRIDYAWTPLGYSRYMPSTTFTSTSKQLIMY